MTIATKPLNPHFGVDVTGIDLNTVTAEHLFPQLRALFEEHSALLFRAQDMTDETHLRIAGLFGPIEDRQSDERKPGETFQIPKVSNVMDDGTTSGEMDLKTLNLKSNFLWHSDSTFLPVPALVNILVGRVVTTTGGATELASTRAAWAMMPEPLKARIRGRGIWHRYSHSRRKISPELAALPMFNKWPDTHWKAIWTNPVNGREALYLASHACKVDGYDEAESEALLEELTAFCTQSAFVYSHNWNVGDVLIWDQRAVMHRGTPWPYDQPRTLSSICSSVTEADGIGRMRLPA
ncbi:TauD/TfdA dioxygenase family protein [Ruegeria marina]|uniref:Alpha-ketoglutarate-dependent 2,4-dichlorophenoxyacetate dioxygenase n=1 Tax=Ruegeria marina TaxID=639004 RepID=A0A1G6UN29_9RHOB|nr:TauD/TfdA family dioxygenase [Ruegeria marina]SDD42758.1 alpha-ketoglutarate-dependent 2,4-dichlorophenoxyacetate dioxygenase [Ruegeria marina]